MKPSLLPAFLIPSLFIRVNSREFVVSKKSKCGRPVETQNPLASPPGPGME